MTDRRVLHSDCLKVLPTLEAESFHSVVTDPPYELGFMGRGWDSTGVSFRPRTWASVARVMKPGSYLAAFGGTRTSHRVACAIEDAGFEIVDTLMWVYGTGFPKSHDVSKAIDKMAGAERRVIGYRQFADGTTARRTAGSSGVPGSGGSGQAVVTAPATPEAARWSGWGTALKPAWEPIILARKPLIGTVAENVLRHGTGGINIDASRVPTEENLNGGAYAKTASDRVQMWGDEAGNSWRRGGAGEYQQPAGRWPANVLHDGSDEVVGLFPVVKAGFHVGRNRDANSHSGNKIFGARNADTRDVGYADSGSAARFFKSCPYDEGDFSRFHYSAKANAKDRAGSKHPTVKPLALMRWLCTLITPPDGRILDPFAGSGTTLQAALECGFDPIGIESEPKYIADINRRLTRLRRSSRRPASLAARDNDAALQVEEFVSSP